MIRFENALKDPLARIQARLRAKSAAEEYVEQLLSFCEDQTFGLLSEHVTVMMSMQNHLADAQNDVGRRAR